MPIHYVEKGAGLHEAVRLAGHWLVQRDGVWESSNDQAVQAVINAYSLDSARAPIIAEIKMEAQRRILAFLPEWMQSNLNARQNELNEARFSRNLTAAEVAEVQGNQLLWGRAKAVRAASNAHEKALKELQSFEAVLSYPWRTTGWPE